MSLAQIDYRNLVPSGNPLNLIDINTEVSLFPLASENENKLAYLSEVDGDNEIGFYLSDGIEWVYQPLGSGVVVPSPTITSVSYAPLGVNETKDITIYGTNFTMTTIVSISNGTDDITVNSVTYVDAMTLTVNVTTSSVSGDFDVTVDNGTSVTLIDGITVYSLITLIPDDNVSWGTPVGAVTTSLGKIVPSSGTIGWGRGNSFGVLPANTDGYISCNPVYMAGQSSGGFAMFGFSISGTAGSFTDIDFAIYPNSISGAGVRIFEKGTNVNDTQTWLTTDVFSIHRTGTVIDYRKNGVSFYTSSVSSSTALYWVCDINRYLGFENIKLEY